MDCHLGGDTGSFTGGSDRILYDRQGSRIGVPERESSSPGPESGSREPSSRVETFSSGGRVLKFGSPGLSLPW